MKNTSTLSKLLDELRTSASLGLEILTDKNHDDFQKYAKRWSDIDHHIPAAIILPSTEEQVQRAVQWAVSSLVPFVTKSGGHSNWSSIDDKGVVIDLSNFVGVHVDVEKNVAVLKGGVLTKEVFTTLGDAGLFTALGNGNSVGAIPYFLGGGASITPSITGFGSDQILAARMIDAKGNLIEVTEEKEPDLLYAIRGAGQFIGLVTQLTVQAHPLDKLGNIEGLIWSGSFVFPLERAQEVGVAMDRIMNNGDHATSGLLMVLAPPPQRRPVIVVAAKFTGSLQGADIAYQALHELRPTVAAGRYIPMQNVNDALAQFEVKGDYKRYAIVSLPGFDLQKWLGLTEIWKRLIAECPDAVDTSFNFKWDSRPALLPPFDSATSFHQSRFWLNNLLWYKERGSGPLVDRYNDECTLLMRGTDRSTYIDFQNSIRDGPIEFRYRPTRNLEKLKLLKKAWDPTGVFTSQLLD